AGNNAVTTHSAHNGCSPTPGSSTARSFGVAASASINVTASAPTSLSACSSQLSSAARQRRDSSRKGMEGTRGDEGEIIPRRGPGRVALLAALDGLRRHGLAGVDLVDGGSIRLHHQRAPAVRGKQLEVVAFGVVEMQLDAQSP